jgi:hypothetical protein
VAGRAKGASPRVVLRALLELATLFRELRGRAPAAAWQRAERGVRERT